MPSGHRGSRGGWGGGYNKGRGGPQSGINVLQVGDTGGNNISLRDLVTIDGYGEDFGGGSHPVSETNHE